MTKLAKLELLFGDSWLYQYKQKSHRLWGFHEHFASPQLPLVRIHVNGFHEMLNPSPYISLPFWPCLRCENGVTLKKLGKRSSICKPCSSYPDILLQAKILYLMADPLWLPVVWLLCLIWFNTTDIMWGAHHQLVYKLICLGLQN